MYIRDSKRKGAGSDQHVWISFYLASSGTSISQQYETSNSTHGEIEQQNTAGQLNCSSNVMSFSLFALVAASTLPFTTIHILRFSRMIRHLRRLSSCSFSPAPFSNLRSRHARPLPQYFRGFANQDPNIEIVKEGTGLFTPSEAPM
jgi:hypothetical protein